MSGCVGFRQGQHLAPAARVGACGGDTQCRTVMPRGSVVLLALEMREPEQGLCLRVEPWRTGRCRIPRAVQEVDAALEVALLDRQLRLEVRVVLRFGT